MEGAFYGSKLSTNHSPARRLSELLTSRLDASLGVLNLAGIASSQVPNSGQDVTRSIVIENPPTRFGGFKLGIHLLHFSLYVV